MQVLCGLNVLKKVLEVIIFVFKLFLMLCTYCNKQSFALEDLQGFTPVID